MFAEPRNIRRRIRQAEGRRPEGQGEVLHLGGRTERHRLFPAAAAEEVDDAILLFEFYCRAASRQSWNAYDSLAEAYYEKGDKQKALELYRKSVELNPASENGKKFIERIENELKN